MSSRFGLIGGLSTCPRVRICRYPIAVNDLVGWNVRSFACGPGTFAAAADNSVITWGAATNGELGFGPNKKSSANPAKVSCARRQ